MWCRALLTAILLAYLLCVLILSGLQKEDLDVALLRKLLRHNINVNDLENPSVRNDCLLTYDNKSGTSGRRKGNPEIIALKNDIAANRTLNISEQNNEVKSNKDDKSIPNILTLINKLKPDHNKTRKGQDDIESQMLPKIQNKLLFAPPNAPNKTDENSMVYITKMIEKLIAQSKTTTPTTTALPTTTPFDLASLMNDIKFMIESRNKNKTASPNDPVKHQNTMENNQINFLPTINIEEFGSNKHDKRNNITTAQVNTLFQEAMKTYGIDNKDENLIYKPSRSTTKAGAKQSAVDGIPSNIIKDIAESVRALVLQDLKKEISTMQNIVTDTPSMPTTDQALIRDATIAFAEFVKLFQHLKTTLIPVVTNRNIASQMQRHAFPQYRNADITTITTNPYQKSYIGNIFKAMPSDLSNLNAELESMPVYKNSINKIEQLNIFNHRNDMNPPPITIQSNVNQIPPLTIPVLDAPVHMVYQNIIVTTESSFDYFKNIHKNQVYVSNTKSLYNDNKRYTTKIRAPPRSDIEIIREYKESDSRPFHTIRNEGYGHQRHQFGREYRVDRMRTPNYDDSYIEYNYRTSHPNYGARTRNTNIERFHEKLERTNDWSQPSSERNGDSKVMIGSRHLLPLYDKKRQKYDDTHFKNFLKTQQKVNDMLERILATKTITDRARSVETP